MAKSNPKQIVIAGAGCAGLAAGIKLQKAGFQCTIFEKQDRVGGLAGGIQIGKNTYEYGPHLFHTSDPEVLSEVKRIAGHVLIPFQRTIKIKFLGKYFSYPLSMTDILKKLPLHTTIHAGLSFASNMVLGWFRGEAYLSNSERVLRRYYGDVLYRIFFRDYIQKVWGMGAAQMDPSFAKTRIPRFDFLEFLDRFRKLFSFLRKKEVSTDDYVETLEGEFFTTKKGFSLICEAYANEFRELGGNIHLNAAIDEVRTTGSRCQSVVVGDQEILCDHFISTVPVNLAPRFLRPSPGAKFHEAAAEIRFRALLFVGLLIKRPEVLPASFMYFRDKSFNRITDLAHFKVETEPDGSTILIAEIACQPTDSAWLQESETIQLVIKELVTEGLIQEDEVLESHVYKLEHGYPIYTVGYRKHLDQLFSLSDQISNFHTIGRQGRFAYINTHIALKMGYDIAGKIIDG